LQKKLVEERLEFDAALADYLNNPSETNFKEALHEVADEANMLWMILDNVTTGEVYE